MKRNGMYRRSSDAFETLCWLYGRHNAQLLMRLHGACNPDVARLAHALGKSRAAVMAALEYRLLSSLPIGYGRLMQACHRDGNVERIVTSAQKDGRRFKKWEIDAAIQVILALIDQKNGII